MPELAISQTVKIILGIVLSVVIITGVALFFKFYVFPFFEGFGEPESDSLGEEIPFEERQVLLEIVRESSWTEDGGRVYTEDELIDCGQKLLRESTEKCGKEYPRNTRVTLKSSLVRSGILSFFHITRGPIWIINGELDKCEEGPGARTSCTITLDNNKIVKAVIK